MRISIDEGKYAAHMRRYGPANALILLFAFLLFGVSCLVVFTWCCILCFEFFKGRL